MEYLKQIKDAENRVMALANLNRSKPDLVDLASKSKLVLAAGYLQRARYTLIEPEKLIEFCYNLTQDSINAKTPFTAEPDWKRFMIRALAKQMILNPKIKDEELHAYRRLMLIKFGLQQSDNPTEYNRYFLSYEDYKSRYGFYDTTALSLMLNELGGSLFNTGLAHDVTNESQFKQALDDVFELIVRMWINDSLDLQCRLYLVQAKYKIEELTMLLTFKKESIYL